MAATSELGEISGEGVKDEVAQEGKELNPKILLDSLYARLLVIPGEMAAMQIRHRQNHLNKLVGICRRNLRLYLEEGQIHECDAQRVLQFISEAVALAADLNKRVSGWRSNGKYKKNTVAHLSEVGSVEFHGNPLQNLAVIKAIRDQYCDQVEGNQDGQTSWSEFAQEFDEMVENLENTLVLAQIFLVMSQGLTLNIFIKRDQISIWLGISDIDGSLKNEVEKQESARRKAQRQKLLSQQMRTIVV